MAGDSSPEDTTMLVDAPMVDVVPARFVVDIDGLESGFPDD
ncbi:hypothetical protein [Longibacter sp.]